MAETITLTREEGGGWTAIDERTGLRASGQTREHALDGLDEATARHGDVRIVKTPEVLFGKPRIEGTRIGVFMIGESIREGDQTIEEFLDGYPDLSREGIEAALDYYDAHPEAMDVLRTRRKANERAIRRQSHTPETGTDTDA